MALLADSGTRCSSAQAGPSVSDLLVGALRPGMVTSNCACIKETSPKTRQWRVASSHESLVCWEASDVTRSMKRCNIDCPRETHLLSTDTESKWYQQLFLQGGLEPAG